MRGYAWDVRPDPTFQQRNGQDLKQNPYAGINNVLGQLGFNGQLNDPVLHHAPFAAHYNHFHIDLRAPERVDLPQNLLTGDTASNQVADAAHIANAQDWLDYVKTDLNLTQGEVTMFIPDMPNVPPQNVPVMIAQANQAQGRGVTATRAVGICAPVSNDIASAGDNVIIPLTSARGYFQLYEHLTPTGPATATVLQQPKHGVLRLVTEADRGTLFGRTADPLDPNANLYAYLPEAGYVGKDTATIQVDFGGGLIVNVKYYFQANAGGLADDWMGAYCSKTGPYWKISSTLDANGNTTINSVEYLPADGASTAIDSALASSFGTNYLSGISGSTSGFTLSFADLAGGAIGQTTGTAITLDDNAANHNWFIDPTPADNSEFFPTSNPYEWVAKEGSAA